ncbi:MAG: hypothetical protein AB1423_04245 [Pseudomonadota bacterium]
MRFWKKLISHEMQNLSPSNMTGFSLLRLLSAMVVRIGGSAFLQGIADINSTLIHHLLTDIRFCTKYADIFRVSLREKSDVTPLLFHQISRSDAIGLCDFYPEFPSRGSN